MSVPECDAMVAVTQVPKTVAFTAVPMETWQGKLEVPRPAQRFGALAHSAMPTLLRQVFSKVLQTWLAACVPFTSLPELCASVAPQARRSFPSEAFLSCSFFDSFEALFFYGTREEACSACLKHQFRRQWLGEELSSAIAVFPHSQLAKDEVC